MLFHPGARHLQLGFRSLGYDPGKIDSWVGTNTLAAGHGLWSKGPIGGTEWAVMQVNEGLRELGYAPGPRVGEWTQQVKNALGEFIDNEGVAKASAADPKVILKPTKPELVPIQTDKVLRQGSAGYVIDTFCLHAAAVPGGWASGKTNREIVAAINRMHTAPTREGGRGWSDTGYHGIVCPDGEIFDARPINRIGAGAIGYNRGVYHLLMIEVKTIDRMRRPEDYFTAATLASAKRQIEIISQRTPITRLMGHNEVSRKLCPGFKVIDNEFTNRAVT